MAPKRNNPGPQQVKYSIPPSDVPGVEHLAPPDGVLRVMDAGGPVRQPLELAPGLQLGLRGQVHARVAPHALPGSAGSAFPATPAGTPHARRAARPLPARQARGYARTGLCRRPCSHARTTARRAPPRRPRRSRRSGTSRAPCTCRPPSPCGASPSRATPRGVVEHQHRRNGADVLKDPEQPHGARTPRSPRAGPRYNA